MAGVNSTDLSSLVELYSSDGKLNFLCNLDLFPTPLIKNCPNATKKWLRAVPNPEGTQDIGINSGYHDIDSLPSRGSFMHVGMVDGSEGTDNNLFPNLSVSDSIDHPEPSIAEPMDKGEDDEFDFQKEKCIFTYSDQCALGSKSSFPSYTSSMSSGSTTTSSTPTEISDSERIMMSPNLCRDKVNMLTMTISSVAGCTSSIDDQHQVRPQNSPMFENQNQIRARNSPMFDDQNQVRSQHSPMFENQNQVGSQHSPMFENQNQVGSEHSPVLENQNMVRGQHSPMFENQNLVRSQQSPMFDTQQIPFQLQELCKKNKASKDLQDTVLNEIITQEINQTIFAKASIGKTQGYLSELLRTSKLLENKSDKEYRRTRHNLDKIRQFLKKPKCERKRIYDEMILNKKTICQVSKDDNKQKRTVLSADAKSYLCEYFCSNKRNLLLEDFQFLASHLSLGLQNVKVFYKNWKQRNKIKTCVVGQS